MLFISSAPGIFLSKKVAVRDLMIHGNEKMPGKKIRRYILSHSHRGITKAQIRATATQAIL